jgi:hypothetical protein
MSEEYKQQLLEALQRIERTIAAGRTHLAHEQLASLIKHLERYEPAPSA